MHYRYTAQLMLASTCFIGAGIVAAAPYQEKPLTCRQNGTLSIVESVNGNASFRLGENYESGEGVVQNQQQAFEWYCNGALQNHPEAQLRVALMLLEGKGTPTDIPKGMHWLNRSAAQGNHDAELALGILLVDTDPQRSAVLFKRAATAGNLYANHRLAELYYYGMGVPQDYDKARELSEVGLAAGFEKSRDLLVRIQEKRQAQPQQQPQPQQQQQVATVKEIKRIEPVVVNTVQATVADMAPPPAAPVHSDEPENVGFLEKLKSFFPSLQRSAPAVKPENVQVKESVAVRANQSESAELAPKAQAVAGDKPFADIEESRATSMAADPAAGVVAPQQPIIADEPVLRVETPTEPAVSTDLLQEQLVAAAHAESEQEAHAEASREVRPVVPAPSRASTRTAEPPSAERRRDVAPEAVEASAFKRGKRWVDQQPEMRYAIQLVQATQLDGIVKFIETHRLQDNAFYIHATQDGQARYILLYGDYPNNRTSKAMVKTLPMAVQQNGYWIRTFGDLRRSYEISP